MMGFKTQLDQPEVEEIPPSWGRGQGPGKGLGESSFISKVTNKIKFVVLGRK